MARWCKSCVIPTSFVVVRTSIVYLICDRGGRNCISGNAAMLRLTKKADYGLMAMKFLAERPDMPSLSAKDIAEAYGIPPQLLAKILQRLTKTGLLRSHAGTNGGYVLSKVEREISASQVILAIDGPFFITSCTKGARGCDLTPNCTIKEPLARVNETIAGVLRSISIGDLVDDTAKAPAQALNHGLVTLTL